MTPEQNKSETVKYPCYICTKYENWKNKHLADGSLPSGVQSVEKSANNSNNDPVHSNKKSKDSQHAQNKTVSLNYATIVEGQHKELKDKNVLKNGYVIKHRYHHLKAIYKNHTQRVRGHNVDCTCDANGESNCQLCEYSSLPDLKD